MLSAIFKNGNIQRIYYYDSPKNDGYPVVQLSEEDRKLKGFNWQPEKRPADRNAVTPLSLRPSERLSYSARPKTSFTQTDIYFPGYMDDVYRQMEVRDSLRAVRERERQLAQSLASQRARLDSLALADSLAKSDSLAAMDSLSVSDSLKPADRPAAKDSLAVSDSVAPAKVLTPEEEAAALKKAEKERKAAEKAKKKAEKQAAREARWAELDKRDAEKAAAKEAKRAEKARKRKEKSLAAEARQAEKDAATLEKYRLRYEKKKAREDSRASQR